MRSRRLLCLVLFAGAVSFATPSPVQSNARPAQLSSADIAAHVTEASLRFGFPEHWIYAVMQAESAGRTSALSHAGAMGLMQLMPRTWARQRARLALGSDPFDPRDNILAGTAYLREMYDSYGEAGFLAAYNAGPGRYQDWRDKGRPLPAETRAYVSRIAPRLQAADRPSAALGAAGTQQIAKPWTHSDLFVAGSARRPQSPDQSFDAAAAGSEPGLSPSRGSVFAPATGRDR